MATLVIKRGVDKTISEMEAALPSLKGKEKELMEYKLNLALSYKERRGLDMKLIDIKQNYFRGTTKYINRMKDLVKDVPGVSFHKRDDVFVVRTTIKGERKYLGAFEKPSDAIEVLRKYVNG